MVVSVTAFMPAVPVAHAQTGPELLIQPATQPLAAAGTAVKFNVSVANMPTFAGYYHHPGHFHAFRL